MRGDKVLMLAPAAEPPAEPPLPPPFPRAASIFVGRQEELARVAEHLPSEVLFLVYGIGGIGKSEFVYKAIEEARAALPFRAATPLLLPVRGNLRAEHLVSVLRQRLLPGFGRRPAQGYGQGHGHGPGSSAPLDSSTCFEDDLAEVARALDARPYLIFIDDVHALDLDAAAQVLGYLSRHVQRSRIFAASRMEILLPADAPPPVILRLRPLSEGATRTMVALLGRSMGVDPSIGPQDPAEIFRRSGGSPFFVRREVANLRFLPEAGPDAGPDAAKNDPLSLSLRDLSAEARRLLILARLMRGRLATCDLQAAHAAARPGSPAGPLWELCRRFLIDIERGVVTVHDLIWEALSKQIRPDELKEVQREAAALHLRRFDADPRRHPVDAIEAIQHLLLSGDPGAAWDAVTRCYHSIAQGELDHLLLDVLRTLQQGEAARSVPVLAQKRRTEVDLLLARILLRRSHVSEAQALLLELGRDPAVAGSLRYLMLVGEVAKRHGQLDEATRLFKRAQQVADSPRQRFLLALQRANVSSLSGRGDEARAVLQAALSEEPVPSVPDAGRWGWSLSLSYLLDDRLEQAARTAADAAFALHEKAGDGTQGLLSMLAMLAMLEAIARVECDEVQRARTLLDQILFSAAATFALREHAAALYRGVVLCAEGDLSAARLALEQALCSLSAHSDYAPAALSGYYLGTTLLDLGDVDGALLAAEGASTLARDAGLCSIAPHADALHARALLAAMRLPAAQSRAEQVLSMPHVTARVRTQALYTVARIHALRGETLSARAALDHAQPLPRSEDPRQQGLSRPYSPSASAPAAAATSAAIMEHELSRAELGLFLGDAGPALVERAERARKHYAACGRRHKLARAELALSTGWLLCGGADDLLAADEALGRAQDLCKNNGYGPLLLRCALIEAAIARRRGDEARARGLLLRGIGGADPAEDSLELLLLREAAALPGQPPKTAANANSNNDPLPGVKAVLLQLGLLSARHHEVLDRKGCRDADEGEIARARGAHELVVDLSRGVIHGRDGQKGAIAGRPLMCALLHRLLLSDAQGVDAETLFRDVWGGREYHPLQHRNTIYVAITRLRRALRDLLPGREIIETAPGGWRLSEDADLCVLRRKT